MIQYLNVQNSKGLIQNKHVLWITLGGPGNMRKPWGKKHGKTHLQADLESRYATAITASVNALFCSCLLAFKALTLNASAASHASHPYCSGGGAIALQTQVIRFHSCHLTLLELIHKQCALSDSRSCCRESSVMLMCDALHAITAKDYGSPTTIHVLMDRKQIAHISSSIWRGGNPRQLG